jgi:hypothetical protein
VAYSPSVLSCCAGNILQTRCWWKK